MLSSECSGMLDTRPATVYLANPFDPSRNSKFGFWSEHHCIYFLTIVLSTIVDVGMEFDPTCRQRNLSSTTALVAMDIGYHRFCSSIIYVLQFAVVQL